MLKARHAAERLQGAWHGGVSSIDQLRARMQDTLAEFVVSRDEAEVRHGSSQKVDRPHISFLWQTLIHRTATSWSRWRLHACSQAARCLAELSVPHYHHEFVKRALVAAFEEPKAAPALLALLAHLGDSNQITQVCLLPKGNNRQWSYDLSQVEMSIL